MLYVCETQDAANQHVVNIAQILEKNGVKPLLSANTNRARTWRVDMLRTDTGFNVLAYGLDSVRRGIKIGEFRPDLIVLDDIDNLNDSAKNALKKLKTITQTVLPTGRREDCAVCFIQNPIHPASVMSRLLRGEYKAMLRRTGCQPVKCIENLKYQEAIIDGQFQYKVTGGTPNWEGFTLEDAEHWMNEVGLDAFLAEYQNELSSSGLMFPYFSPERNGYQWHVVHSSQFPLGATWKIIGSHDYGEADPCCSLLAAQDEWGDLYIIGETYQSGWTSERQAAAFLHLAYSFGLANPRSLNEPYGEWDMRIENVAMDWAYTFPPESGKGVRTEYPVQKWWNMLIPATRANKERITGWRRVNEWLGAVRAYMDADGTVRVKPRVIIFGDMCPNLIRLLKVAPTWEKDIRDLDHSFEDHPLDAFRYLIMSVLEDPQKPVNKFATAMNWPEGSPFAQITQEFAYNADD